MTQVTNRREREQAEPQRTCIGCRRVTGQSDLVRIARRSDGTLVAEHHGERRTPGRGAWLCQGSRECFDAAAGRGALGRALRTSVSPEAIDALRARLFH